VSSATEVLGARDLDASMALDHDDATLESPLTVAA
jgi:hypothetical protein